MNCFIGSFSVLLLLCVFSFFLWWRKHIILFLCLPTFTKDTRSIHWQFHFSNQNLWSPGKWWTIEFDLYPINTGRVTSNVVLKMTILPVQYGTLLSLFSGFQWISIRAALTSWFLADKSIDFIIFLVYVGIFFFLCHWAVDVHLFSWCGEEELSNWRSICLIWFSNCYLFPFIF